MRLSVSLPISLQLAMENIGMDVTQFMADKFCYDGIACITIHSPGKGTLVIEYNEDENFVWIMLYKRLIKTELDALITTPLEGIPGKLECSATVGWIGLARYMQQEL